MRQRHGAGAARRWRLRPRILSSRGESVEDTGVAAELLRTGWGRALLILAGVLAVVAGVETGRRSVRLDFRERFTAADMPRALAIVTRALGAVGCAARAVVFVLVGVFLLKAAVLSSATQAKGLDAVFRSVASPAYGPWLLAVLASGLVCLCHPAGAAADAGLPDRAADHLCHRFGGRGVRSLKR